MAIDEWLLEQHRLEAMPPCLRFYNWNPVAISLGYHQRHYPDHWNALRWQGQRVDVVQRPSGGRAVLHQGDLTYALIAAGFNGRRRDVYTHLCQFLIRGWQSLGVNLQLGLAQGGYQRSANCFGTATAADLVMDDGYKVIGSAQLYRDRAILQHGSMRLSPAPHLVEAVFGTPIIPPQVLSAICPADIMTALATAAQQVFVIEWIHQPLSPQEQQQALAWAGRHSKR